MTTLEQHIAHIRLQLLINSGLKSALLAGILIVIMLALGLSWILASIGGAVILALSLYSFGFFKSRKKEVVTLLHERYSSLEYSLELLEKPALNQLELLQLERIRSGFRPESTWIFHHKLGPFVLAFFLSFGAFGVNLLLDRSELIPTDPVTLTDTSSDSTASEVFLEDIQVTISPPDYTGLPATAQKELEITALRGSQIMWELTFGTVEDLTVTLVNQEGKALDFEKGRSSHLLQDEVVSSGIYSIRALSGDSLVFDSGFFPFKAVLDLAPVITPAEKEVYRFHFSGDAEQLQVMARISDDFLVSEVYLVATLARGSGENVKFRESRIPVADSKFKSAEIQSLLDLKDLDFKEGDELYYYWAAIDNRRPEPNFSRSDTYFIKYVDSTGVEEGDLPGMAIHVLPEYFRSQRQIIIDTEKLIHDKSKLDPRPFNETSNEIGYEQKLLRMRYGQYLGEEFESNAGGGSVALDESGDLLKGYIHAHDQEGEHEHPVGGHDKSETKGTGEGGHAHEVSAGNGGNVDDGDGLGGLLDAFIHNHESEEMNTFYEESTRGTLKMALEQMWQSELHLRLFEPEKALPYQYKALEYLKAVQQKSRLYVQRTGFDPPPIKEEEKRLSGNLDKLEERILKEQVELTKQLQPLVSRVLGLLETTGLSAEEKQVVQDFAASWTQRMQYSGIEDWSVLVLVQRLMSGGLQEQDRKELYRKLYPLLGGNKSMDASYSSEKALEAAFWRNLK